MHCVAFVIGFVYHRSATKRTKALYGHTRYEQRMHASHGLYGCSYPVSDVPFRNLAWAVEGMPLIESDSVLGVNGNKWEAHAGATTPGQFCAFDSAQRRAVRS